MAGLVEVCEEYGWSTLSEDARELPIFLVDVDGTVRGDVLPMVRLARPLVPNYLKKVMLQEPVNASKSAQFVWNLAKLWTFRTLFGEQRRRYKHLFSELHGLAAALLRNTTPEELRDKYRHSLPHMRDLWSDGAVKLLSRATRSANVVLVTGSEQIQTEECVRLLADRDVNVQRIFVRGSLYGFDSKAQRFTGSVEHLNVTLDGKRDTLRPLLAAGPYRCVAAAGNSRPDRSLFDAVEIGGLRVLVCSPSVLKTRKQYAFVIRKLERFGYRMCWDVPAFLTAVDRQTDKLETNPRRPILATDNGFANVLQSEALQERYPAILAQQRRGDISPVA